MNEGVRLARPEDAARIAEIYAPIVTSTWISFEEIAPSEEDMRGRIAAAAGILPFLCCERSGEVAGYAYASKHRDRAAYRWSIDVSAYVDERFRRCGVARALYRTLFEITARQGYHNAFAGITLPNDASVGFHRSLGFSRVGRYRSVGFKLGAWHDTLWLQRELQSPAGAPPQHPVPLALLNL